MSMWVWHCCKKIHHHQIVIDRAIDQVEQSMITAVHEPKVDTVDDAEHAVQATISVAVLAEKPLSSPQKIFIFIIKKNICWLKVSKNKNINILKKTSLAAIVGARDSLSDDEAE